MFEKFPNPFLRRTEDPDNLENDLVDNLANAVLLQFISGDAQSIKRSFFVSESADIRLCDIMDGEATIARIYGEDVGEPEKYDWLIIIKLGSDSHFYKINTPGNMGTLESRIENYSLSKIQTFSHGEVVEYLEIEHFKELMEIDQNPEKIDIVFSGSVENKRQVSRRKSLEPVFN